jgi:hypothetical protein
LKSGSKISASKPAMKRRTKMQNADDKQTMKAQDGTVILNDNNTKGKKIRKLGK